MNLKPMGNRWTVWVDFEMVLRIVVDGAVRREFVLCEKPVKLRSVTPCFDAVLLLVNYQNLAEAC